MVRVRRPHRSVVGRSADEPEAGRLARRVAPCRRHRPGAAAGADAVAASVGRRRVRAAAGAGGGASRSADQDSHRLAAARLGVRDVRRRAGGRDGTGCGGRGGRRGGRRARTGTGGPLSA